jgi:hypothetical protein
MGYTINDSDKRYNGWTNYATWRVNLEIFDGRDADYFDSEIRSGDVYTLSKSLKEYAEAVISDFEAPEGLAMDYARAFLAEVNFYEIAQHMMDAAQADAA